MRAAIHFRNTDATLETSNITKIQIDGIDVSPSDLSLTNASTITFFCQKPSNRSKDAFNSVVVKVDDIIAIELR